MRGRCPRPYGPPPEYFGNDEAKKALCFFGVKISPPEASREAGFWSGSVQA